MCTYTIVLKNDVGLCLKEIYYLKVVLCELFLPVYVDDNHMNPRDSERLLSVDWSNSK